MERTFALQENQLQFRGVNSNIVDGVSLTKDEQQYLLPHFLMMLIGKPGSGKTTLLKQLLTNNQMYYKKFDEVVLVSPSYAKMGIKIKEENVRTKFSLDWIFQRLDTFNQKQSEKVYGHNLGGKKLPQDKLSNVTGRTVKQQVVLKDENSRFQMASMITKAQAKPKLGFVQDKGKTEKQQQDEDEDELAYQQQQQQMFKDIQQMPFDEQQRTHVNVLIVLDDVVGSIKKAEYDPRLAQLVMNRRHLIFNGTVSIIVVSQKYTLIPARVRSNANWLIVYQLNPMDFETIYRDAVIHSPDKWRDLLQFVFGKDAQSQQQQETQQQQPLQQQPVMNFQDFLKDKKFENLGIWVEFNVYFKNFKRIIL